MYGMKRSVEQLTEQFEANWTNSRPQSFLDLLDAIAVLVDAGELGVRSAAGVVSGCWFVDGVDDDPLREQILMNAGSIAPLPDEELAGAWEELLNLIAELREELASTQ
jgi:hypothetical protein